MRLAENTAAPSFRQVWGYLGSNSQYARIGLGRDQQIIEPNEQSRRTAIPALKNADQLEQGTTNRHKSHCPDKNEVICPIQALTSRADQTLAEPEKGQFGETRRHREEGLKRKVQLLHGRKPAHGDIPDMSIPPPVFGCHRVYNAHSDCKTLLLVSHRWSLQAITRWCFMDIPKRSLLKYRPAQGYMWFESEWTDASMLPKTPRWW